MPFRPYYHRPRTGALRCYYDEGVAAARQGDSCPYDPPTQHGDGTRAWLWQHGFEDEQIVQTIAQLV